MNKFPFWMHVITMILSVVSINLKEYGLANFFAIYAIIFFLQYRLRYEK